MTLGVIFGIFALFFILVTAVALWNIRALNTGMWLCLAGTVGFTATTLYFIGVALKSPTALRMDARGISGFYADPATWAEIAYIESFANNKGHMFLGFTLRDHIAFRDRQTPWRRRKSHAYGRSTGHHIIVPEALLLDASAEDLARSARAFHAASG